MIALAGACLEAEPEDRPRDANAVADRITGYLAGVQERVQVAERERAVAVARAIEERKRRKVQLALAASVLAITTMGGLGLLYEQRQRSARAATVVKVIGEASTLRDLAHAEPEDPARWQTALAALKQAEGVAGGDAEALAQLAVLRVEVQAGAEAADRDRVLLDKLVDVRSAKADDPDGGATDAAYAGAFQDAKLDLSVLPTAEAGARIKARPPGVALALAAALDDWSAVRRGLRNDRAGAGRLAEVARVADPDPWRNDLRAAPALPGKEERKAALKALADTAKFDELGAVSLDLLGNALADVGDPATAERVMRRAQIRHSGDVWVNYDLARALERLNRPADAVRFYTAARALRPETAHELAHALSGKGESDEGIEVFRDLARLRPLLGRHLVCLGLELKARGRPREAAEAFEQADAALRKAIRLRPDSADAHHNLGNALFGQGKVVESIAAYREAIRLRPDSAGAHVSLGTALFGQGEVVEAITAYREAIRLNRDYAEANIGLGAALKAQGEVVEAIAAYREAIRLKPDSAMAHYNLGAALKAQGEVVEAIAAYREAIRLKPDSAMAHYNLGTALKAQGEVVEAIAAYREAIRLKPDHAAAHYNLGNALFGQGEVVEAIAAYREAIRLKPDYAEAHIGLGAALFSPGKVVDAIAAYHEAIRLNPDLAEAHYNLGKALNGQKKVVEANAAYREAIRLNPDFAEAHCNLGGALRSQGEYAESLAMYRRGHELGSKQPGWPYPSAQWVADAEKRAAMAGRLSSLLKGDEHPKDNAERLTLAQICSDSKRQATAARFWAEAFEADPTSAIDLKEASRYNAACAATLAGSGQGKDDPAPDEDARSRLRTQAREWLHADLGLRAKQLESGDAKDRVAVVQALQHWKNDPNLAEIRDAEALAKLTEVEREDWRGLWADVDVVLTRALKP